MKNYRWLLLTLVALQLSISGVMAQHYSNLSVALTSPDNGAIIGNGENMLINARLINLGPDTLQVTDTLYIFGSLMTGIPSFNRALGRPDQPMAPGDTILFTLPASAGVGNNRSEDTDTTMELCLHVFTGNLLEIPIPSDVLDTLPDNNTVCINITFKGLSSTGIANESSKWQNTLNLYPNPAVDLITFEWVSTTAGKIKAIIRDVTGREVLVREFEKTNTGKASFPLDIATLESGLYLFEVHEGNHKQTKKLVIKQ